MIFKRPTTVLVMVLGVGFFPPHVPQYPLKPTYVNPSLYLPHDETHTERALYRHVKEHSQAVVSSNTTLSVGVFDTLISTDSATGVTTP